jgi:hypothetical protein
MPIRGMHTFAANEVIDSERMNENFRKIHAKFGTMTNEDFDIGASISSEKVRERSQTLQIKMNKIKWAGTVSTTVSTYSPDLGWYHQ